MLHSTSELTYDIKLADFGIAKLLNQKSQNQYYARNQSMGTACYMAPEALSVSKELKCLNQCFARLPAKQLLIQQGGFMNSRHFFQH